MTPARFASSPIGSCSGATPAPNFAFNSSSVRENDARSRSSLFTKIARGSPRCSASFHAISVCTSTPSTAETTNSARSAAWIAAATSPTKSAYPGASRTFTLWSSSSNGASASETEMLRRCSSGSKSQTVEPSSTRPRRTIAPALNSRASANDVFPAPPWPTSATLRILAVGNVFTDDPLVPGCLVRRLYERGSGEHQGPATASGPDRRADRRVGRPGRPLPVWYRGRSARERERGTSEEHRMLDRRWRKGVEQGLGPIGDGLRRLGITADALTVFGLACSVATAVLIGSGHLVWAVVALSIAGVSDLLDGSIARGSGQASPRGAFFDSVTDRASDALLFGGVAWHLAHRSSYLPILAFAVAACSMLISYERARAESLGLDARGGLMERAERFVLLGIALAFPILVPMLWLMLGLTAFTAVQRFVHVYRLAARPPQPAPTRPRGIERPPTPLRSWWMARRVEGQRPRSRPRSERRGARP